MKIRKLTAGIWIGMMLVITSACAVLAQDNTSLKDGIYEAEFKTDSSMFHVNEAKNGKGILRVDDGMMTIHISLASKNITNLYAGISEDAKLEGAEILEPTVDTVTYSDGISEEVYGFDVPIPYLDEEFDLALIGKKGVWYDHKVSVSEPELILENGNYLVDFETDSSMFHVNEADNGKGKLTVEEGQMTLHISMPSKNIVNLFLGKAEEAQKEGAVLIEPTEDTVTYSDGMEETVYGFDIPITVLDEKFDLALIGKKGKWYDHRVSVSDPEKVD